MRLWVDTDIGDKPGDNPDDAVALALAAAHPGVDLVGVSTVSGDRAARADAARRLVDTSLPVVSDPDDLPDGFRRAAAETLLAIGPLTNVARLLDGGVRLPEAVVVMGGALRPVRHRGAVRAVESNFGADPAATRLVLDWTDAMIVPLDVTVGMVLDPAEVETLRAAQPALAPVLSAWPHQVVLHDPLALLVAAGDAEARTDARSLAAEADGRLVERKGARVHPVVVEAGTDAATRRIVEVLGA